jgi:hypothetical protein
MNRTEFATVMARLAACYRENLEEPTLEIYFSLLNDFDGDLFREAAMDTMKEIPRFPSVAELRERMLHLRKIRMENQPRLRPAPSEPLPIETLMAELRERMHWR